MSRKKLYFDDVLADLMLVHTLNHATFKGAGWNGWCSMPSWPG